MRLAAAAQISPSKIRAIALLADQSPDVLRLFYGEDTRPTPDFIKSAAKRAIDANLTYYTPNAGYPALRQAIARQIDDLHGAEVDPTREVVVTASGMVAIVLACQATIGPGDSALVVTPLWPNVAAAVRVTGAEAIEVPLRFSSEGYTLDIECLRSAVRTNTRLLALASPGNPTGWTATSDDWRRLVAFCHDHDLWLLADCVYDRLVREGRASASPLAVEEGRERVIVAQSFSKAYRMTGWRVGYNVAPAAVASHMAHLQEFVVSHAAGFTQEAARIAILEGEPFVAESQARYQSNRSIAVERLRRLDGVVLPEPPGAFYVFPRLEGLTDSFAFCEWLVRERGLGVAPGSAFGAGGEGHVRICFAVDEETLNEALDRFESGWRDDRAPGRT